MPPSRPDSLRRLLLKAPLIAGAAAVAPKTGAQTVDESNKSPAPAPSPRLKAAEAQAVETGDHATAAGTLREYVRDPGSDFMIETMRAAGIAHVALAPGSTFRGLQESLINHAEGKPGLIVCMTEEVSAALAHGYAKASGEMIACLVHSNVGLQHASMALYNAWCDRAPIMVLAGNILDATQRRPGVEWTHTQEDVATIVRDFVKWDDYPASLQHFAESFMRAASIARTPPNAPVLIVADADLQERDIPSRAGLSIPRRSTVAPPAAEGAAIERVAALLVAAERPLIVADRMARSQEGVDLLVRLAELLQAPVIDQAGRMNMPSIHYLNHSPNMRLVGTCDVLLGLELGDLWGVANSYADLTERTSLRRLAKDARTISISASHAFAKPNVQDSQRYFPADETLAADAQASLPTLITAIERRLTPERRAVIAARADGLRAGHDALRKAAVEDAAAGWDGTPISTARVSVELWEAIQGEDWALVSDPLIGAWPLRLWDFTRHYQHIGGAGGYGLGYGIGAAVGAALAHKEQGRIAIDIQGDGDLMMLPSALWTLAHHEIPLLIVVHNNRAWHQELMHLQRMTNRRDRGTDRAVIGTVITDPPVDHAGLARSMGVWAEGPITDPAKLAPAIRRALAVVKGGKPALLDVVMQPR